VNYYIINTDVKTIGKSHSHWVQKGFAYTGGPAKIRQEIRFFAGSDLCNHKKLQKNSLRRADFFALNQQYFWPQK
jgi:hypothetical protein